MATKILPNKIYHCQSPAIAGGSFQPIGGKATIFGSNVTEYTEGKPNKLIVPSKDKFVATDDEMEPGIHLIAGMPEWFYLTGSFTECWVKMGVDVRIEPVDAE